VPLVSYTKKRDFRRTSEPKPAVPRRAERQNRFVVQEHHARRLHFDFRLEAGGVLKSWAVPKGLTLDPAVKRLAVMTEDHPVKYLEFEGTIPAGNYGAGEMAIWDSGTYEVLEGDTESGVQSGKLVIRLHGSKLHGEFHMVKLRQEEENQWLVFKGKDDFADPNWELTPVIDSDAAAAKPDAHEALGRPGKMPDKVAPMLATLADGVPAGDNFLYELKWDGFRVVCFVEAGEVRLVSRNHNDLTPMFPEVVQAVKKLGLHDAVLDGEVVALDSNGAPSFQLLQNRTGIKNFGANKSRATAPAEPAPLVFYLFDLLHHAGRNLTKNALTERREALQELLKGADLSGPLRFSDAVQGAKAGASLLKQASEAGLEGVIAKDIKSPYVAGRSANWLKLKLHQRQEVVIGGFTEPRGTRKGFGALVVGLYDGKTVRYVGHAGSGFNARSLKQIHAQLEVLETSKCPFTPTPATNEKVHWVKPELVCEVKFSEWTADGNMRHPIFLGMRQDKAATECVRETAVHVKSELHVKAAPVGKKMPKGDTRASTSGESKSGEATTSNVDVEELFAGRLTGDKMVNIEGATLKLTNLDKKYWPADGYTKGDLLRYYWKVADAILPHLRDRPVILQRFPSGIEGAPFYQHTVKDTPEFLRTWKTDEGHGLLRYAVCDNLASLLYLANLGTIAQNPWHSRVESVDRPDWLAFDLDPEGVAFPEVCAVATALHATLKKIGLEAYAKTSGSSGMHVYVPLEAVYSYEQVQGFALLVANLVQTQFSDFVTIQRMRAKRGKRHLYLDCLQNERGKSVASVYSVRARSGATVSTPLSWAEVNRGVRLEYFDINTVPARLKRRGDLFKGVLEKPQRLEQAMPKLEKLLSNQS